MTQKNRTRLASNAVPKLFIPHVYCKSFSNVQGMETGTKIIGKDGSCTMVNPSVVAAMSNYSPLLKSILNDPPPSLESIRCSRQCLEFIPQGRDHHVFSFDGFRIHITSNRIPPVQKQKSKTVIVSSGQITIIRIVTRAPPQSPALFPPTQKWLASRRSRTRRRTSRSRSRIPSRGESLNLLYSTVYIVV